ncbi:hypothetical protein GGU11DRAFT_777662 [Lentinula aff. detonsa]|nr:hypothetical protein GGU11DRAFT_777662 [Lentinula aff. detonsa]
MASSSSSRAEHFETSSRLSRSILVDIEAEDSDTQDNEEFESEDEATAIERGRQNAESVSLRPSDHIDSVQRVASAWEEALIEQERRKEAKSLSFMTRRNGKRKAPDPTTLSPRPRKRTLRHSSPPPPNTFRHEVETCKGTVVIYLKEIPGECQLDREMRIYEASEVASAEADRDVLREMSSKLISPASVSCIPMPPEVPLDDDSPEGAATPTNTPAHPPKPLSLADVHFLERRDTSPEQFEGATHLVEPRIHQGWFIVKRLLEGAIETLPEAQAQIQTLLGGIPHTKILNMLNRINDLDPDEFEQQRGIIEQEINAEIDSAIDADVEPSASGIVKEGQKEVEEDHLARLKGQLQEQQLLGRWVTEGLGHSNAAVISPERQIFCLFCRRGKSFEAFAKISSDIEAGRVHPSVLRCPFQSRYPGRIYIQAYSVLPQNTRLAAYLRTVPGLLYRHSFKTSFPNEDAWSRQEEKKKHHPHLVVTAHDLAMPIHLRVEDVRLNDDDVALEAANVGLEVLQKIFRPGTWATIKSGRYRGDLGIVVDDDFAQVDTSHYAQLIVVPRIKYPGSSRTRPPKAPIPVDFNLPPTKAWSNFMVSDNVRVTSICIQSECSTPFACDHQEYSRKRYRFLGQTVRGGFVLLVVKLEALDLALRVPDDVYTTFRTIAEGDDLGKIPPLSSWTFETNETVILTQSKLPAALPGMYWREDLGSLKDGAEGVIQKVGDLVCDVAFKKNGQLVDVRSVAYRHLVKVIAIGQTVRLAPGVRDLKEIQWVQQGDSGVMSVVETELKLANSEGLVTGVFIHLIHGPSVSVWIHASSLIVTLSSNSVVNMSYSQSLSLSNPRHPASADDGHIPSSTATCDIRDATTVRRNHWKASENVIAGLQTLTTPQEHFTKNHRSSCVPWLGIRVYLRSDEEEQQDRTRRIGEVVNVEPDSTNERKFLVLIHWDAPVFGDQLFEWCGYEKVRRIDNHGLLHEFTPYSGPPPWKGVKVKVIKTGVYKNREADVVDVRADPVLDRDTISGISVYIRFHDGDIVGEERTAWVDYHYIRRCDTRPMRFLHDSRITGKGTKSYYVFKVGYCPRYSPEEISTWKYAPSPTPVSSPEPEPPQPVMTSPYLRFEATRVGTSTAPDIPVDFWILDRRIWSTLGPREIDVARLDGMGDLRLSVKHESAAITFYAHQTRIGSSKQKAELNIIHPGMISRIPFSISIKGTPAANGLYIICNLEPHTGKLARRLQFTKSFSGKQHEDTWLLQIVKWTLPEKGMNHTEELTSEHITTTSDHFVKVHETLATANKANEMLCRLRNEIGAPCNGYTINEHGQVVKQANRSGPRPKNP